MTKRLMTIMCLIAIMMAAHAQSIMPQKNEKNGRWGYVSKESGKWVVKPKYEEATELTPSPNGELRGIVSQKGKKGLIDDSGKILGVGVVFEEMTPMQGNAMFVKVKGKTGVADYNGVYLVKPEAENTEKLGSEGWIISIKGKKGLLANDGKWLIDPIYNELDASIDDIFIVNKGGKAGILSRGGETKLLPGEYTKVEPCGNLWKVHKGDKVGLLDLANNKLLVKPKYSDVNIPIKTSEGVFYPVASKGKWGYLYSNGKKRVSPRYTSYMPLPELDAILLFRSSVPDCIDMMGERQLLNVREYKEKTDGIFKRMSFKFEKNGDNVPVEIITLPDQRKIIASNDSAISENSGFYEVTANNHHSVWDKGGKMLYESAPGLNLADKYLLCKKRANESESWKSYVKILEANVIENLNGDNKYEIAKTLFDSKDTIGEDTFNQLLDSCEEDPRVELIMASEKSDPEFGKYLYNHLNIENISDKDKESLYWYGKNSGLLKEDFIVGDFEYSIRSLDQVAANYIGKNANVVFPSSVTDNGITYNVVAIKGAQNKDNIVSVEIPATVRKIEEEAFAGCKKLSTVKVPENISLDKNAFENCSSLNYLKINIFDPDYLEPDHNAEWREQSIINDLLYYYKKSTLGCPKILSKLGSIIESLYSNNREEMCNYIDLHLLDHYPGTRFTVFGDIDEMNKFGADLLRKYANKGNPYAMIAICNSFLDNDTKGSFKNSEFAKYAKMLIPKKPASGYYFMGLAYEYGIGVTPSRSTAHRYYAKGRELNDSDCDSRYWKTF